MPEESGFLVVGLGNPGPEYAMSPHNIGFMVVDRLAETYGIRVSRKDSKALVGIGEIEGRPAMLAKPQTFMNLSGTSVKPLIDKHGIEPGNVIVVYDDHDLDWLSLRIRQRGSAGGHHGMEDVIRKLGTNDFPRVRLGINPGGRRADPDYLLRPFRREQLKELGDFLGYAADAVAQIIAGGAEMAMTRFNRRAPGQESE